MNSSLSGSTIRIQAIFKDFNDNLVDPSSIKIVIYDKDYIIIDTFNSMNKASTGVYYYNYKTKDSKKERQYFCEITGIIDGTPVVLRDSFSTRFM